MPRRRPAAVRSPLALLPLLAVALAACSSSGSRAPAIRAAQPGVSAPAWSPTATTSPASPPLAQPTPRATLTGDASYDFDGTGGLYLETLDASSVSIRPGQVRYDPYSPFGTPLRARLAPGPGRGIGIGFVENGIGFGLFYLNSEHEELYTGSDANFHGAFVEQRLQGRTATRGVQASLTASLGMGFGGVTFADDREGSGSLAGLARISAGLVFLRFIGVDVGAGYFYWGDDERPLGEGQFISTSMSVWL